MRLRYGSEKCMEQIISAKGLIRGVEPVTFVSGRRAQQAWPEIGASLWLPGQDSTATTLISMLE